MSICKHNSSAKGGKWTLGRHLNTNKDNFNSGVAQHIVETYAPTSVLDFGCGIGWYCEYFSQNGVSITHGIEPELMDQSLFDATRGCRQFCFDITCDPLPHGLLKQYDLIFTLEVMEHIPLEYHEKIFDFFQDLNPKHIVFSGARIGQKGHGHISCRSEEDWRQEITSRGYTYESEHTLAIRLASNKRNVNHRKNLQVFTKATC